MKDKPRNPVARSPIMKKGGVHQKSRSTERQQKKGVVQSELDEWQKERDVSDGNNQD